MEEAVSGPRIEAAGERSIGAQQIRDAFTGDVVLPAEALHAAERVTAAPGTSNLPPPPLCLGRQDELAWLRHTLTDQREGAITQSGTVHGLGGVGKSTLALHYAHCYRGDYTLIWWIGAASPDEIETALTALTQTLVPGWAGTAGRGAQVAWAKQWLAWHPGWLLVYDNVDNPEDLAPYTGALNQGHHLATSRLTIGWPDTAPTLPLGNLHPDDATTLLCRLAFKDTAPTPRQQFDARALAADLGHLPLAIKQAGAYLAQNRGISLDAYRRRLGTKLAKTAHGLDAERTIARVWNVTLQVLEQADPLAVQVLHTAAWLAPDDIPYSLLTPPGADLDEIAEAIGTLAAYSMITDTGTHVSVHRLVQTVLRAPLTTTANTQPSTCPPGRQRAERTVLHHVSPPGRDGTSNTQWDTLIPHLAALAATTPPGHHNNALTSAYNNAANRLHQQGHTARTIPLMEATLAQRKQVLGDAHPETLISRNNLASALLTAGNLGKAVPLLETTLAQYERVFGDTHPETLTGRGNLACAYRIAGDLGRAIPLLETTLAQCEQVFGDTYPQTLICRGNLANAYQEAGNLGTAIPLMETTLNQCEQVFGDTHPEALTSRGSLARAYREAGDLGKAIPLLETTLAQREQVLGNTHPDTLTSRSNLANAYQEAGDLGKAIPLLEATLAQREQVFGDTHPDTLTSRSDLAGAYRVAGDLGKAIPLLEATLAQREQVFGDTHPQTLICRGNLANAYQAAGDLGKAIPLLEATLAQCEQVFGDTHPHTFTSRNNLASTLFTAGDLGRATSLLEATLAQREQVLGNTHPDTLTSRNNLATTYYAAGDLSKAIPLYEATLTQREQILGNTHPDTLTSRNNLATTYYAAGDLNRAIPLYEAALTQREQILGNTDPDTLTSRNNLASARQAAEAVQHGSTATSATEAAPQRPSTAD
ncbi:tetratricopeptide repeat protein [Streptomyces sp. 3214.6]|uniref:tetratricopeptide repeat protein n=1 Tax=Streptomyces sp. 3214.6 TaxID=1882757 RepID=UPI000909CE1B|nr:tetratricopeptide repeat protein [Streptomyces sp. 3214.6]SHI11451.1 Tetratricopeptide (TPR) repeat [Streptomyces sp. 3214.6]